MITPKSTIREVYKTPVGKDLLDRLLRTVGRRPLLLTNPVVGKLRLAQVERLLGKRMPGLVDALVRLLGYSEGEHLPAPPATVARKWWKEATVYQIYPRSFQDSNGDGVGDLAGIKSRIPYLKELGVDAVWLSPIYDSPGDDMGYDIRNYKRIDKLFGTLKDFDALLAELHKNDIRLIMDLVVNHTSDEHAWFRKALKDPASPERDYYIWAKGKNGKEPNNWLSFFSGPAWNQYGDDDWALHLFSKKQMDLNWDNPALRAEIYGMINWWLERGVDGFRLDVINLISKDNLDNGSEAIGSLVGYRGIEHYVFGPRLHEYLSEMRIETFDLHNAFTVGEPAGTGMEMAKLLSAEGRGELDQLFNFDHMDNPGQSRLTPYEYDLRYLKPYFIDWQTNYGNNCWQALVFENHDNPRMISKIQPDPAWRPVVAKLLALLQFSLKGTPYIYQGQEIGMTNTAFSSIDQLRDVEALNRYHEIAATAAGLSEEWREDGKRMAFETVVFGTRDHARTPMQWSAGPNAGFTEDEPWIGVNPNYPAINVENEQNNPDSVLHFFKALIALRKQSDALVYGGFHPVFPRDKDTFCYFRMGGREKYYVEINLTGEDAKRPGPLTANHRLVCGNYGGVAGRLRPYEANLYRLGPEEQ